MESVLSSTPSDSGASDASPTSVNESSGMASSGVPSSPTPEGSWRDSMPESHRDHSLVQKYQSADEFFGGLDNLQKMASGKGFERPGADSPPEAWNEFYSKAGRPDSSDDYSWTSPMIDGENGEQVPEFNIDNDTYEAMRSELHGKGLTDDQFSSVMEMYTGQIKADAIADAEASTKQYNDTLAWIDEKYGDNAKEVTSTVQKAVDHFGLADVLENAGLNNSPEIFEMLANLAETVGESRMVGESVNFGSLDDQISGIVDSKAYNDVTSPGHHQAMQKLEGLYKRKVR